VTRKRTTATKKFERLLDKAPSTERYVLRLYVSGDSLGAREALTAIETLCRERLAGRYRLEVIDVYQHPQLAKDAQITALPMLVRRLPPSLRRLVGNLSDKERVLVGLGLQPSPAVDGSSL
jgi:circadian clock protein KaiB